MSTPPPPREGLLERLAGVLRSGFDATAQRYAAVGLVVTLLSYALLFTLVAAFSLPSVLSNFLTLLFGLTLSFILNRQLAFRHKGAVWPAFARFAAVVASAYMVNLAVLHLLLVRFQVVEMAAQFLAFSTYTVLAYVLHRFWTFAEPDG